MVALGQESLSVRLHSVNTTAIEISLLQESRKNISSKILTITAASSFLTLNSIKLPSKESAEKLQALQTVRTMGDSFLDDFELVSSLSCSESRNALTSLWYSLDVPYSTEHAYEVKCAEYVKEC